MLKRRKRKSRTGKREIRSDKREELNVSLIRLGGRIRQKILSA